MMANEALHTVPKLFGSMVFNDARYEGETPKGYLQGAKKDNGGRKTTGSPLLQTSWQMQ